jgi:putative transposase
MEINSPRKSFVEIGKIYFWTATINTWNKLLADDEMKEIIISSLQYLSAKNKIEVYAFVIMPNHVHLVWQMLQINGKEMPHTSFLKFTAHSFKKYLKINKPDVLKFFAVEAENKEYEFWQRDSLAFELIKKATILQKIDYIHYNPTDEKWKLCFDPVDYCYSSAKFYESRVDEFGFLKHIGDAL